MDTGLDDLLPAGDDEGQDLAGKLMASDQETVALRMISQMRAHRLMDRFGELSEQELDDLCKTLQASAERKERQRQAQWQRQGPHGPAGAGTPRTANPMSRPAPRGTAAAGPATPATPVSPARPARPDGPATPTATHGATPARTPDGGQPAADADHTLWMDATPEAIVASLAKTVRFTEWVMQVWPAFGKVLPVCWFRHPQLVAEMDALRLYALALWAKPDNLANMYSFLQALHLALSHLRTWAQDDAALSNAGHRHGESPLETQARDLRLDGYRTAGMEPDVSFPWPFDPVTGETPT